MSVRVDASDRVALAAIVGKERAFFDDEISCDYAHDEMEGIFHPPEALLKVISIEEVSKTLAYCSKKRIPVVVRGSGTGLVGGAVAVRGGVMLDMTHMNKILELDEKNMTVRAEAGVLLMDLAAFAEAHGLLYPPDPGEKTATIGGNISTNAGGMRAVKYGVTRDYILSLTVVMADGSIETFGVPTVKNSSGYSIKDLIIGSEGTLCVIAEATLRLLAKPAASSGLLAGFETFADAVAAVPKLLKSGAEPTAMEFLTRRVIALTEEYLGKPFPKFPGESALLMTYDGSDEKSVSRRIEQAADICLSNNAIDCYLVDTEERIASVWQARGAFFEAIKASAGQLDEGDMVVPRAGITDFVARINEVSEECGLRVEYFGHAGDGNLHVYFCRDGMKEAEWKRKLETCFDTLYRFAAELNGTVSGEHGIGYAKRDMLKNRIGVRQMELMRRIKKAFDPKGILNPCKVCMMDHEDDWPEKRRKGG